MKEKKHGENKVFKQLCSLRPRDPMPTYPFQESERRSSALQFLFVFVFFSGRSYIRNLASGQQLVEWSLMRYQSAIERKQHVRLRERMPRRRDEEEILSVSSGTLKQGRLKLLYGLCFLEIGNLRSNGSLKQGRSKHSNDSLKQGRFKLPFPFYQSSIYQSFFRCFLCIF